MKKNIFIIFPVISVIIFCGFSGFQGVFAAPDSPYKAPENLKDVKVMGEEALNKSPGVFNNIWQGAFGVWKTFYEKSKSFWFIYIQPPINNIWNKTKIFLNGEVEKRKPGVEAEFEKEKKEVKQEAPGLIRSLWQKLKNLLW